MGAIVAKPERKFCSRLALAAEEPLAGSAMHYLKYIFIGLPKGQWAPNAALSKGVPDDLANLLKSLKGDPRRIAVRFYNMKDAGETTDIILCPDMTRFKNIPMVNMATVISDLLDGKPPNALADPMPGKHMFVCAHGVRDMCCAKFGFGTIRGMRNAMADKPAKHDWHIWEVTHLVGDRFAGTAVQFPEGHMYGYLSEDVAADWLSVIDSGQVDLPRYRGNIYLKPNQQVAEAALLEWLKAEGMTADLDVETEKDNRIRFVMNFGNYKTRSGTVILDEVEVTYFTNCKLAEDEKASVKTSWVVSEIAFDERVN